jgi:hypothetical protein
MIELWIVIVLFVVAAGYYQHILDINTIKYDDQDVPYKLEPEDVRIKEVNQSSKFLQKK